MVTTKKKVEDKPTATTKLKATKLVESLKRKTTISKSKQLAITVEPKPIQLNAENEERMAEWRAQEADKSKLVPLNRVANNKARDLCQITSGTSMTICQPHMHYLRNSEHKHAG